MLEHVFVAETAVAAGNGCIGRLGVLWRVWLLLGDRRPFAEVDSRRTHALRSVTVTASQLSLRRNGLSRDQIGDNAYCRDRARLRTLARMVRRRLSPTLQMITPDPANQTATQ